MAKYLNNLNNFSIPYDPIANLLEGDPHFQPPSFANTWLGSASYFSQYSYANSTVTQANGVSSKTIIPAFTLTGSAGGLQIKLLWDSSLSSNPNAVAFMAAIVKAAGILESEIKTTAVINLQVGWGEIAGQSPGSGAAYGPFLVNGSNCFITSSGTFYTIAQAQALGLINSVAGAASSDGSIGFSSSCPWAYADTSGINLNSYDIVGCALHELTHALGRLPGSTAAYTFGYQTSLAPFTIATNWSLGGSTIYGFSIDGGKSILNYFCPSIAGDPGDWLGTIGGGIAGYNFVDQANASMTPGAIVNTLTFSDLVELSILGYQIAASPVSMSTLYFSDVIDDIQIEKSLVTQISLSDNVPIAITAGQLSTDASALAKISGAYTLNVSDSSANVATYLNTLQTSIAKITSISLSDINAMTITAAQSLADNSALAKISSAYNLTINGTTGVDTLIDTLNATSTMTGGTGIDTFIAVGHDTITDLGLGGADILQVAATGVVSAKLGAVWTATSSTSNLGQTIIDANGFNLSLALVTTSTTGSHGYQIINTGSSGTGQALIGSALADTFTDGHNGDALSGGLGIDTFNITSGTITIRDLGAGGADVLNVSLGATVTANLAAAWTASSSTVNYGTTSIYGDFNVNVSAANTTAANSHGYTIWDNSGTSAVTEVGSGAADVLVAGHALDILTGGGGRDIFDIGASLGTSTTTATNYVKITDFVVGTSGDYLYSQDAFAAGHALHADVSNIASGWTLTNGFASKSGSTEATFYAMCKGLTFTADTAIGYTDGTNDYIYIMGEVSQANSSIVQLVGVHVTAISTIAAANSILIA